MEKLLEAIAVLFGWANQQEVVTLIQDKAQPIYQAIFNKGHATGERQTEAPLLAAKEAKEKAEADLKAANATIQTLKTEKPDLATMQKQHDEAMTELKKQHIDEKKAEKTSHRKALLGKDRAVIRAGLIAKDVPEGLADILVQDITLDDRIDHDANGASTVFQAGTKIPVSVGAGQSPLDSLVEEYLKKVPSGTLNVDVDEGSETTGHTTTGGGKKKVQPNKFDKIRSDTQAEIDARKGTDVRKTRTEKLGTVPAR